MRAVRDGGPLLLEGHRRAVGRQGRNARAQVAADTDLRRGRCDQPLPCDEICHVVVEERRAERVPGDAAHLDLVHREHHAGGCTRAAEVEAGSGELLEADPFSSVRDRDEG